MRYSIWALGLAFLLSACPKEKTSPAPAAGKKTSTKSTSGSASTAKGIAKSSGKTAVASSADSKKAAGASKTTQTFTLAVAAPKGAKVGAELPAKITLKPHGEYHVNMLYPFKVTVDGPADSAPKQTIMHKKDAKTFTKEGVLLVHKTKIAKAGEYRFSALVKFSVCTESHCEVKKETLVWSAKVQ